MTHFLQRIMEQFHYGSQRREEADELNLREWPVRARIKRENTSSRRFSGSNIRSFREDGRSFRSNLTISSTASSPGCYSMRGTSLFFCFNSVFFLFFFLSWILSHSHLFISWIILYRWNWPINLFLHYSS